MNQLNDLPSLLGESHRILVTGGAGFIGGALIRRLLNCSEVVIYNLDKIGYASDLSSIQGVLDKLGSKGIDRHHLLKVDLADAESTCRAVSKADPDLIFHLAAESHVDRSIDSPSAFIYSNVIGTFNLLQAARSHWDKLPENRKRLFRFHHISTDEVFGSLNDSGRFSELTPYSPRSPYSASKAASDHLVNAWFHTYGLPVILTNCSNNYGPWQFPEKLIPVVILKAISGEAIPLYGDGSNVRDWLYVEDHIDALLLAILKGAPGRKYCIGGNSERTNLQIVERLCLLLDRLRPASCSYTSLIKPVIDRPGHDYRYAIDAGLITTELGWTPAHDFENGLKVTVAWYLENLDWCEGVRLNSGYKGERLGS